MKRKQMFSLTICFCLICQSAYAAGAAANRNQGAASVSFVVVGVNYCIYKSFKDINSRKFFLRCICAAFMCSLAYGFISVLQYQQTKNTGPALSVCAIQPNIDFKKKLSEEYVDEMIDGQIALTLRALERHDPVLVVWPETSVPFDFMREDKTRIKMKELIAGSDTSFLIGTVLSKKGKDYNSTILLDDRGNIVDVYKKKYLVPFSEYTPRA